MRPSLRRTCFNFFSPSLVLSHSPTPLEWNMSLAPHSETLVRSCSSSWRQSVITWVMPHQEALCPGLFKMATLISDDWPSRYPIPRKGRKGDVSCILNSKYSFYYFWTNIQWYTMGREFSCLRESTIHIESKQESNFKRQQEYLL